MPGKQVWFTPSRVRISLPPPTLEEVRHRRGHRLESGCRIILSWVRFPLLPPFSRLHWFSMLPTKFMTESCVFCKREVPTRGHHVVPRCKGGTEIVPTCHSCEDFIHKTWSHNELRDTFNSVDSFWPTLVLRNFSSGYINNIKPRFSEANVVGIAGLENIDSEESN